METSYNDHKTCKFSLKLDKAVIKCEIAQNEVK